MPNAAQDLTILTGHSRGMGLAMARQLLAEGHAVLGIARQPSGLAHPLLTEWQADLADAAPVAERLAAWLRARPRAGAPAPALNFIHNAGVMAPLRPVGALSPTELMPALRVGLEAGVLLTSAFLAGSAGHQGTRRVLHISSGLGRRAMAASAAYCAAKAGVDHFCRAVALEYPGVAVVALAPGVFDTDMQHQLRGADPGAFPDHARFMELAARGELASPEVAAARVLAYLARPDFGAEPVADVRG